MPNWTFASIFRNARQHPQRSNKNMPSRREFMKTVGQGTLAAGMYINLPDGAWLTPSAEESAKNNPPSDFRTECDVLVIGGGFAGMFAAIKAREQGADVVLVSKGRIGKSGQTPLSSGFMCFNGAWGDKLDVWVTAIHKSSEYLSNREWSEIVIKETYPRYLDLVSYGVEFQKEGGELVKRQDPWGPARSIQYASNARYEIFDEQKNHAMILRRQAIKIGVKVMDRVMMAELIKQNGRIVGAVGMSVDSDDLYTLIAKSTILCVGPASFKPAGYPMVVQDTGDGEGMAYRAGAEILGKEFVDTHFTVMANLDMCSRVKLQADLETRLGRPEGVLGKPFMDKIVDAEGNKIPDRPAGATGEKFTYPRLEFLAHEGKAPLYWRTAVGDKEVVGAACQGMSLRKADGIWPADKECRSTLRGLFAAGDALGTMENGAVYAAGGSSTASCTVTGNRAALAAAKEAREMGKLTVDEKEIARAQQVVRGPSQRRGGFSPRWVTQLLQNTVMPYFVTYIKKADRLQAAITQIEFMQEHLVPMLFARDAHELRLAHEIKNMVLSAEIRLKSALFRTESRGNHYREDYPRRDDQNWLAWTKVRQEDGKMRLIKVPMPKEWGPDPSLPYEQRYPFRYPGEDKA
jgi:succinate dehydrogenase/fumarate reductase flavoprotein subunit